jgi:hypothetical protein
LYLLNNSVFPKFSIYYRDYKIDALSNSGKPSTPDTLKRSPPGGGQAEHWKTATSIALLRLKGWRITSESGGEISKIPVNRAVVVVRLNNISAFANIHELCKYENLRTPAAAFAYYFNNVRFFQTSQHVHDHRLTGHSRMAIQ